MVIGGGQWWSGESEQTRWSYVALGPLLVGPILPQCDIARDGKGEGKVVARIGISYK